VRLHREVSGDGPPVLLVRAAVADSQMWEPLAGHLVAAGHRAVACDPRGFGRSPRPTGRFSHAADLVELLDDLAIDRAAVVGASWGGKVTLELALRMWIDRPAGAPRPGAARRRAAGADRGRRTPAGARAPGRGRRRARAVPQPSRAGVTS
jgi:pimeloyl-ACP methyl ester carboxylesterase